MLIVTIELYDGRTTRCLRKIRIVRSQLDIEEHVGNYKVEAVAPPPPGQPARFVRRKVENYDRRRGATALAAEALVSIENMTAAKRRKVRAEALREAAEELDGLVTGTWQTSTKEQIVEWLRRRAQKESQS